MAYLRWGQKLPSGKTSSSFVIGDPDMLINFNKGKPIPYAELKQWFKTKNDKAIKKAIGQRLKLRGEELNFVCERLFEERDNGEWS